MLTDNNSADQTCTQIAAGRPTRNVAGENELLQAMTFRLPQSSTPCTNPLNIAPLTVTLRLISRIFLVPANANE